MNLHFITPQMLIQRFNLKSKTEILKGATPINSLSGIYFLMSNNEIVYVGQSKNIYARIHSHSTSKKFDSVSWVLCDATERSAMETAYIMLYEPKLNGRIPQTGMISTPIKLQDFISDYFYKESQEIARRAVQSLSDQCALEVRETKQILESE